MDDELVELLKRARIEEQGDTLPRRQLPLVVLPVDASLSASQLAFLLAALELVEPGFSCHRLESLSRAELTLRAFTRSVSSATGGGTRIAECRVSNGEC